MFSPFILLCVAGFFALFSSTISKNPSLPLLVDYLGGSETAIGFVAAASAFSGIVFSLPAGLLADRFGKKRLLIVAGGVFATSPFLYLLTSNIWQLSVIRLYHGLATAIFGPVSMALVIELYEQKKGERLGCFSTATLLGRFLAPAAGGLILSISAVGMGLQFTPLYLLCGIADIIALSAISTLPATQPTKVKEKKGNWQAQWRKSLLALKSNRIILATCAIDASILFCYGIFETFLPLLALTKEIAVWQTGLCISSQVVTIAITKPFLGKLSDRKGRAPQILAGITLATFCMIGFGLVSTFWQMLFVSALFGLSMSVVTSASAAYVAEQSERAGYGSAMGALGSIMDIGHSTGPIVGGILATTIGLKFAFMFSSAILIIGAGCFLSNSKVRT